MNNKLVFMDWRTKLLEAESLVFKADGLIQSAVDEVLIGLDFNPEYISRFRGNLCSDGSVELSFDNEDLGISLQYLYDNVSKDELLDKIDWLLK